MGARQRDPRDRPGAAGADPGRGVCGPRRRGGLRRPDQGVGRAAQRAHRGRLPLRHPRGHAPARARRGERVRRQRPDRRQAPAAPALQAVVPGHRLDPTSRGRAPAALGTARLLPAPRLDPARAARLAAVGPRPAGPADVGLPPPEDRAFADVWSALGGELKPSLDVVVTAPTDTGQRRETGPPVVLPPKTVIGVRTGGLRRRRGPAGPPDRGASCELTIQRRERAGELTAHGRGRRARAPVRPASRWSRPGCGRSSSTAGATTRRRTTRSAAST